MKTVAAAIATVAERNRHSVLTARSAMRDALPLRLDLARSRATRRVAAGGALDASVRAAVVAFFGVAAAIVGGGGAASAQMTTIGTPFRSVSNSFYESVNMGWSVRGPNFSASFGGANSAVPDFGGYNPNAGIQSGFSFGGGPFSGGLSFGAAQGSSSSISSVTPSITTMNGQPGFLSFSRQRPFVTGLVPLVGAGPVGFAPIVSGVPQTPFLAPLDPTLPWQRHLAAQGGLNRARGLGRDRVVGDEAAAGDRPMGGNGGGNGGEEGERAAQDDGVANDRVDPLPPTRAERERQQAQEEAKRLASARVYYEKGVAAERTGKPGVARLYFEMAARRGDETLKDEAGERLKALADKSAKPAPR